jgi:hypothetical protein
MAEGAQQLVALIVTSTTVISAAKASQTEEWKASLLKMYR